MRVGNGRLASNKSGNSSVHPHACGERLHQSSFVLLSVGSSPCVWGTAKQVPVLQTGTRFIPMRVGNGTARIQKGRQLTVHPHACGERTQPNGTKPPINGSSPCVWGTEPLTAISDNNGRFIPMRVGNGDIQTTRRTTCAVHPHACGERLNQEQNKFLTDGSSPCVWGTGDLPPSIL